MKQDKSLTPLALVLGILLACLTLASLLWILVIEPYHKIPEPDSVRIAEIYQDGHLLQSIRLDEVSTPYTFTVTGSGDRSNEISVRQGSIGILSASCPDKLCVHQGYIDSSLLPITCLPNHLVIQVRIYRAADLESQDISDAVTY